MHAMQTQDQGIIDLFQMDELPILIDSFLIDRRAQSLSGETVEFYRKKLKYFLKFCESQAIAHVV